MQCCTACCNSTSLHCGQAFQATWFGNQIVHGFVRTLDKYADIHRTRSLAILSDSTSVSQTSASAIRSKGSATVRVQCCLSRGVSHLDVPGLGATAAAASTERTTAGTVSHEIPHTSRDSTLRRSSLRAGPPASGFRGAARAQPRAMMLCDKTLRRVAFHGTVS